MSRVAWDFMGNVIKEGCTVVFTHNKYDTLVAGIVTKVTPTTCKIVCAKGHEGEEYNPQRPHAGRHHAQVSPTSRKHSNVVVIKHTHEVR